MISLRNVRKPFFSLYRVNRAVSIAKLSTETEIRSEDQLLYKKSEYATSWKDEKFPEWQQFLEVGTKRQYFHNRKTNDVSWTHPSNPDPSFDIVTYERTLNEEPLLQIPKNTPPASLLKRTGAFGIDIVASAAAGCVFATIVYIDLQSYQASLASVGFTGWLFFIGRDLVLEQGTRSFGKKVMKIEIVTKDGALPSRYNNFFRQLSIPLYAASGLLMPYIFALPVIESGVLLFSKDYRRIGDFIGRTRVIPELPDREKRLQQKKALDEKEALLD